MSLSDIFKRKDILVSIGALIVSIVAMSLSTCWHYDQGKKLKQMQGAQNRPLLSIFNKPIIYSFKGKNIEPILTQDVIDAVRNNELLIIETSLTIDTKITLTNKGNSIAKLLAWMLVDRPTGDTDVRNELFNAEKRNKWKFHGNNDYYETLTILPGKEHTFNFSRTIANITENREFTLHYYFLYQDELGNIYDSYYWARYTSEVTELNVDKAEKLFLFKDKHFDTKMFFNDESETILSILNNVQLEKVNE